MKKIIVMSFLVVGVIMFAEQQASAWVNSRFGIGLSDHKQSANTSLLWGLWRNGQIPGPDMGGQGGSPYGGAPYGSPYGGPRFAASQPGFMPMPSGPGPVAHQGAFADPYFAGAPYATAPMNYGSPYQFANYPRPSYYYPSVYYPSAYYYGN